LLQLNLGLSCDHALSEEGKGTKLAYLSEFQKLIYPDLPFHRWGTISKIKDPIACPPYTLVYNAKSFEKFKTDALPKDAIEGNSLRNQCIYDNPNEILYSMPFPEGDPICYLIYLPQRQIVKGFIVTVYGAAEKNNYHNFMKQPAALEDFDHHFLQKGWGIVKLNLVDLLDPLPTQHSMPERFFHHVLDSMYTFLGILRKTPEKIHESLDGLSNKSLFLEGQSFGGNMVINYLHKYPGTISGALVHNGKFLLRGRDTPWIDVSSKSISDHLYLIHPYDDNRTEFDGVLGFVKKSHSTGNEEYIHLHLIPEGAPHPVEEVIRWSLWNPSLKGHSYPQTEELYSEILTGVEHFLNNPQQPVNKLLNRWIFGRWNTYYAKDQPIKNLEEDFLSRSIRVVEALPLDTRVQLNRVALGYAHQDWFQKIWQEKFQPVLAHSYLMIGFDRDTIYETFVHGYLFDQLKKQNEDVWADLALKSMQHVLPAFRKYILERFATEAKESHPMENSQLVQYFEGIPPSTYREDGFASTPAGKEKSRQDNWKTTLLPYFLSANPELCQKFISNIQMTHGNLGKFFETVPILSLEDEEPATFKSLSTLKQYLEKYPYDESLSMTMQKLLLGHIAERFKETQALVNAYRDHTAYLSEVATQGLQQVLLQDIKIVNQIRQ